LEAGISSVEEHTYNHEHGSLIKVEVTVTNGALATSTSISTGVIIDLTSPNLIYLHDTEDGKRYDFQAFHLIRRKFCWELIHLQITQQSGMARWNRQ